jgi:hypothetical protein
MYSLVWPFQLYPTSPVEFGDTCFFEPLKCGMVADKIGDTGDGIKPLCLDIVSTIQKSGPAQGVN